MLQKRENDARQLWLNEDKKEELNLLPYNQFRQRSQYKPLGYSLLVAINMLPRRLRLTKNADILKIMRQGNKITTPYVWLYLLQRTNNESSRAACVVGKKVHQLAVRRHRYQRWLRQLADTHIKRLSTAYDMVWVARPEITEVKELSKLQESLQVQLDKLVESNKSSKNSGNNNSVFK